jgi:hypothetical protein
LRFGFGFFGEAQGAELVGNALDGGMREGLGVVGTGAPDEEFEWGIIITTTTTIMVLEN